MMSNLFLQIHQQYKNLSAEQLVDIVCANAISFANMMNMNSLGAFLTYSTNNSGKGENPDLVREAVKIATERGLNVINGEMQFDSAYDLNVRKAKFPKCSSKRSWSIYFSKPRKL
nr:phosphate acyltransferase [Mycoplasmopsis bovis]